MNRIAILAASAACAVGAAHGQVTYDRIANAQREPQNWLSYSATLDNQRFSPLAEVNTTNVGNLELKWVWQARSLEKFEATPLVVDGVLYTVQAPNDVIALDAKTGRVFWTYHYEPSPEGRPCCGRVNRGLAILGDTLYMGTIDAHLLAIDAKSGRLLWDTQVADAAQRYSITMAPNIIKDKVIVGTSGGDFAIRGYIAAFDAKSGKEIWRFHTIPAPGEPGNETWAGDSCGWVAPPFGTRPPSIPRPTSRSGARVILPPTGTAVRGSATTSTATASWRSTSIRDS